MAKARFVKALKALNPFLNTVFLSIVVTSSAQALTDWKVEYLTEFDPDFYLPPDDTAPFIRRIEITTERPEPVPPLQQRH